MNKRNKLIIAIVILAVIFAGMISVASLLDRRADSDIEQEADEYDYLNQKKISVCFKDYYIDEDGEESYDYTYYVSNHNIETYLFAGTDYSGNENASGDEYMGSMADVIILMILDRTAGTYAILPVNRDTMMDVPIMNKEGNYTAFSYEQICCSHTYGYDLSSSCENLVYAVSTLLGDIPITGYYVVSMSHIGDLNNIVGGVTLTIEEDYLTELDPAFTVGSTVTFTDQQAEAYIRARMSVGDGLNTTRMKRDNKFFREFLDEFMALANDDAGYAVEAFDKLTAIGTTSLNGKIVSCLANYVADFEYIGEQELTGESKLGTALEDGLEHMEYVLDEEAKRKLLTELFTLEPDEQ